jgi:two-component system nitrogen regulation sensor histidine kinase NtrY
VSFRSKVFLIFLVTVLASVSLVAYGVSHYTRIAFEQRDHQLTEALAAQFRKEYNLRSEQIARQVKNIADAELTYRVAIDLAARPNLDQSLYAHEAVGASQDHDLEFCEFVSSDGTIISSAQYPTHVGHKNEWVTQRKDWNETLPFLRREELPDSVALGVFAVRAVNGGNDKYLYIIGGKPLDSNFLSTLVLPAGLRALLYRNLDNNFVASNLTDTKGPIEHPEKLQPLIDQIRAQKQEVVATVNWDSDAASAETFHAIALPGRDGQLLGVLLVGSSRRELVLLTERIVAIASIVAAGALLAGLLISFWVATRITRPVEELAAGAREVAAGRWETRIDVRGIDEVGQLGIAFNDMTRTLATQRERLLQTERVAAWRELARRLAHELRNPLFPLQITVENLQRAKQLDAKQFQEVFNESTATLKAELTNLNSIVGRFSDFSKMPAPQFAQVDVNEALRNIIRLFEPQFNIVGKPPITPEYSLTEPLPLIDADAVLLHRAFQNLVLNAVDAMPAGGTLALRTFENGNNVRIEISDTGSGLTAEECARLFTPYYTTKHQGTGLGLAIVQSVISDHHGTIRVTSEEGRGTTFHIELPQRQAGKPAVRAEQSAVVPKTLPQPPSLAAASD